jgi:curved DNA-binding protein CbpA
MSTLDEDAMLEMVSGLDWSTLSLSKEQGFVLTRVVGKVKVRELMALSGLPETAAKSAIVALVNAGALSVDGKGFGAAAGKKPEPKPRSDADYKGFVFSPANLGEQVDLKEEQKKRILYVHAHLEEWNHYALLGLKRTAKNSEIKRGYFKASKEFHPDAYFRKEMGTYAKRVDEIFRAMKKAYDVLGSSTMRTEYDSTLGADFTPEELAELEELAAKRREKVAAEKEKKDAAEAEAKRMKRLEERKKARRVKRNPMVGSLKKGREYAELAKQALAKKDLKAASRHAKMAMEFSRQHASIKEEVQPILVEADQAQAEAMIRQQNNSLSSDAESKKAVADQIEGLAHGKAKLLLDAADLYVQVGDVRHAIKMAQLAVNANDESERGWRALADYAERGEQWHTALRAAEKLLTLAPKDADAKERVKRLKRSVR